MAEETTETIARGIWFVSTPSHGYVVLSQARNAQVPAAVRDPSGYYEEDSAWAIAATVFADEFAADFARRTGEDGQAYREHIKDVLREWHPEAYEVLHGVRVQPGESRVRDEAEWLAAHSDDWIVVGAEAGPVGIITDRDGGVVPNVPVPADRVLVTLERGRDMGDFGLRASAQQRGALVPRTWYQEQRAARAPGEGVVVHTADPIQPWPTRDDVEAGRFSGDPATDVRILHVLSQDPATVEGRAAIRFQIDQLAHRHGLDRLRERWAGVERALRHDDEAHQPKHYDDARYLQTVFAALAVHPNNVALDDVGGISREVHEDGGFVAIPRAEGDERRRTPTVIYDREVDGFSIESFESFEQRIQAVREHDMDAPEPVEGEEAPRMEM